MAYEQLCVKISCQLGLSWPQEDTRKSLNYIPGVLATKSRCTHFSCVILVIRASPVSQLAI